MNKLTSWVLGAALMAASSAQAEDLLTEYYSLLGPVDAFNSRGLPLNDLCSIVQQDRANWHRFGKREEFDRGDPFFTTSQNRAAMTGKCDYSRDYYANAGDLIRSGSRSFYVYVRVYGSGGRVTRVHVVEGAG